MKFLGFFLLSLSVAFAEVDPVLLSEQTLERFKLVPEFEFIIQEAQKLGVKVYLFGGTASAFAHYVRWDLEREAGDDKYQKERFDYDFTNIYRGNQDLDIVVDGSPEQADQLKVVLQKEYPHFVGSRDAWEVRLLRQSRGDKRALLGDEDFKKQHSDTNSTGMLLLNPDEGGIVYNDLLNWGSPDSDFLNDVAAARIKFLYSDEHEDTERFKNGFNPPVLAAIRYLAKLAQYEVEGTAKDLKIVTQIIAETDFTKLSAYGKKKAEEFALKTLLNAPDSEYAWNLLEKTGARIKLIEMDQNQITKQESLSWWMNKEPLRSKEFGIEGKTALEIFGTDEIIVSHETTSFKAYDNITRSSKGGANAFISRNNMNGEAAAYGDGFYTRLGQAGARGTGLTIRFKLHPDARKDVDFTINEHNFVVIKNKKALRLIQENLNLSLIDFLKLLMTQDIGPQDKGLREKFNRKFSRLTPESKEFLEALEFAKDMTWISDDFPYPYDFNSKKINSPEDLIKFVLETKNEYFSQVVLPLLDRQELWESRPDRIKALIQRSNLDQEIVKEILSQDWVLEHPDLIEFMVQEKGNIDLVAAHVFSQKKWQKNKKLFYKVLTKATSHEEKFFIFYVFSQGLFTDFIKDLKEEPDTGIIMPRPFGDIVRSVLSNNKFTDPGDFVVKVLKKLTYITSDWWNILQAHPAFWIKFPEMMKFIIKNRIELEPARQLKALFKILSDPVWLDAKEIWETLFSLEASNIQDLITFYIPSAVWLKYPHFFSKLLEVRKDEQDSDRNMRVKDYIDRILRHMVEYEGVENFVQEIIDLESPQLTHKLLHEVIPLGSLKQYKEIIKDLIKRPVGEVKGGRSSDWFLHSNIVDKVLSLGEWADQKELIEDLINKNDARIDLSLVRYVFTRPYSVQYSDWMDVVLKRATSEFSVLSTVIHDLFPLEIWSHKKDEWFANMKNKLNQTVFSNALNQKNGLKNRKILLEELLSMKPFKTEFSLVSDFSDEDKLMDLGLENPAYIEELFESENIDPKYFVQKIFTNSTWQKTHPEIVRSWIQKFIDERKAPKEILLSILTDTHWSSEVDWFKTTFLQLKGVKFTEDEPQRLIGAVRVLERVWENVIEVQSFIKRNKIKWPIDTWPVIYEEPLFEGLADEDVPHTCQSLL